MGEMKPAIAREEQDRQKQLDRYASTLTIAAAIIAAVRLAREPDVGKPSPRMLATVMDPVTLARMILDRVMR